MCPDSPSGSSCAAYIQLCADQRLCRRNVYGMYLQGLYALFETASEAYLCRDDTYAWFSRKMGSKEKGMRLRRGYEAPRAVRLRTRCDQRCCWCGISAVGYVDKAADVACHGLTSAAVTRPTADYYAEKHAHFEKDYYVLCLRSDYQQECAEVLYQA